MPDFCILTATDELEQRRRSRSVRYLQWIEVAQRRKLALATNREPIIEDGLMLLPLGIIDCLECVQQLRRRRPIARFHACNRRAHSLPPLSLREGSAPRGS